MILYSGAVSPRCRRVLACAHHLGVDLEIKHARPQTPEVLKVNPNGKIPVLQDGDFSLYESDAILMYLADKKGDTPLYPKNSQQRALVNQWLFWTIAHFDPAVGPFLWENVFKAKLMGQGPDAEALEKAAGGFMPVAKILDDALAGKNYLLGSQITLADYSVAGFLMYKDSAKIPLEKFPNILKWFARIEESEYWKKAAKETPGF
jgi:glutathione S-transferase